MTADAAKPIPRRIGVLTAARAEWGLVRPIVDALATSATLEPFLIVMGAHLSPPHGQTVREIEAEGYRPDLRIECLVSSDTATGMATTLGVATLELAAALPAANLDALLVLGDRYELLAPASVALLTGIPLIHVEGGHVTEGAIDDSIRHAVTKMAHVHFTATERYARRIVQLGEPPESVHVVGSTGLDALRTMTMMDRPSLEADLGFAFADPTVLVTFHPETAGRAQPKEQMAALLDALEQRADLQILFTLPNPDAEGLGLGEMVRRFVADHPQRSHYHVSLGHLRYLSVLGQVAAVVGNSSSGLIEVPSFGIGTLNIGHRQDGRIRAASVIDCPETTPAAILDGLAAVLDPAFRDACRTATNPFGDGRAGQRIVEVLETIDFANLGAKRFYDLPDAALSGLL